METPEQYQGNPLSHGNYQFSTLKDIVDGILMNKLEEDNFLKNTNRSVVIYHAKMVIKELTRSIIKPNLAIEMTVGEDSCIVLPQDFVSCSGVSVVAVDSASGARRLLPLDKNQNINTAVGYLQDDKALLVFDDQGEIVTADASNAYNMPYTSYEYIGSYDAGNSYLDTSIFSVNGEYKVDRENGKLVLDSRLINKEIVLVYKSDGLQWEAFGEREIKVHKYMEEAVKYGTIYACIENRQTVPDSYKTRISIHYRTAKFKAKKDSSGLNLKQIAREMRSKSKY